MSRWFIKIFAFIIVIILFREEYYLLGVATFLGYSLLNWLFGNNPSTNKRKYTQRKQTTKKVADVRKSNLHYPVLLEPLARIVPPYQEHSNTDLKYGKSEAFFYEYLISEFGKSKVKNNELESIGYYPDFAYIDTKNKIFIAIEIDEPYAMHNQEPIHYIDGRDDKRNDRLRQKGWAIIRFSEKQIYTQPKECCEFISHYINQYHKDEVTISHNIVKKDKRWSYDEAVQMPPQILDIAMWRLISN